MSTTADGKIIPLDVSLRPVHHVLLLFAMQLPKSKPLVLVLWSLPVPDPSLSLYILYSLFWEI